MPRVPVAASVGEGIVLAQADPRINGLEEEVRRLNGRVEELNFLILQMEDKLRRMQEDNEFRFQELEGKRSEASGAPATESAQNGAPSGDTGQSQPAETAEQNGSIAQPGEPPRTLGTITFDESGNIVTSGTEEPMDLLPEGETAAGESGGQTAALPDSDDPNELYRNAYEFVLSGDYVTAESGFRRYIERFPGGENAADANFWLGESLLGQERYREAAEVFLQANREFPSSAKAPEMLLKLGISLAALDQQDVACATYDEIGQRYPQVSDALRQRVQQERTLAGC
ncbi:tol-pal system protein YbgF [Nitratireductor luteus]|uniref:tol-pal system protein YbgF n=1 Tax=Nitratireductor luteus TaxID=2976980 RepID=UPI0022407901|nr:tol-pal system protein YbgF [Nitratireductor luteus]